MHTVLDSLDRRPALWLVLGALLVAASQYRFGIDALAWVSWVPFLRYLRLRPGPAGSLLALTAVVVASTLGVAKIVTEPLPLAAAPLFGVPIGLFLGVPLVVFAQLRRRLSHRLPETRHGFVALLFPASMVVGEYLQHTWTGFASWGAAAYTQLDDLALLQVAALGGLAAVSFVVYLVNAGLEHALHHLRQGTPRLGFLLASAGVWLSVETGGAIRLASFEVSTDTVRVAAVGTDATFGGLPLPTPDELQTIHATLERRTRAAAAGEVKVVVWNEGSTLVMPEDRDAFAATWAGIADELNVEIVAAWITPIELEPLRYENISVTFHADGSQSAPYLKHHPVPGEPAVVGTGPLPVLETAAGRMGTAICYDGDFPSLAARHASNGIGLLAVPSSDWRGIDPIHTEMIRLRAIEGGYSVLRSTRLGLSAGIDAAGRVRSTHSWFDSADHVMVVDLPWASNPTLYSRLGDWLVSLCVLACTLGALVTLPSSMRRAIEARWQRLFRPSGSERW